MLDSLTPHSRSLAFAPATSGSITEAFQRAWTMAMRRLEPSWCWGAGPLREDMVRLVRLGLVEERGMLEKGEACDAEVNGGVVGWVVLEGPA